MKPELEPCPFCGGEARLREDGRLHNVYCIGCTASVKQHKSLSPSATDKWNRRAQPAEHNFASANEYHAKIVKVLQEYGNVNEMLGHVKIITFNHDELLEAGLNLLAVLGNDVTIQVQPAEPVKVPSDEELIAIAQETSKVICDQEGGWTPNEWSCHFARALLQKYGTQTEDE